MEERDSSSLIDGAYASGPNTPATFGKRLYQLLREHPGGCGYVDGASIQNNGDVPLLKGRERESVRALQLGVTPRSSVDVELGEIINL